MANHDNLICWSCQTALELGNMVHVDRTDIPCCNACWLKMPVQERLRVAQMFRDRADGGVLDAVKTVFRSAFGQFVSERGGIDWLRGRDGN